MRILITGGTGFVGRNLTAALVREGHEITILTRSGKRAEDLPAGVSLVVANPMERGNWQLRVEDYGIIINLAGESIFGRWNSEKKELMRESRLLTTRNLVEGMKGGKGKVFLSASAVGFYGFCADETLTEDSPPGADFLARLAQDWEKEALRAGEKGARVVLNRFGIVLGEKGGALSQMIPLFEKNLGGPLGSGKQWFSWVHMEDLAGAFLFLLGHPEISGPVNYTSPNPVRNRDLARALGKALNRPSLMPAPAFMLKLILGEFGSVLLEGQKVVPQKLLKNGFQFRYPEIDRALEQIVHPLK